MPRAVPTVRPEYAPLEAVTGSLYVIVAWFGPVIFAETIVGIRFCETDTDWAARALLEPSCTSPCALDVGSSTTPIGVPRLPLSLSTVWVDDMAGLPLTVTPAGNPAPESCQVAEAPVEVALTASLNTTVISLSARDSAETIVGAMPSDGFAE